MPLTHLCDVFFFLLRSSLHTPKNYLTNSFFCVDQQNYNGAFSFSSLSYLLQRLRLQTKTRKPRTAARARAPFSACSPSSASSSSWPSPWSSTGELRVQTPFNRSDGVTFRAEKEITFPKRIQGQGGGCRCPPNQSNEPKKKE